MQILSFVKRTQNLTFANWKSVICKTRSVENFKVTSRKNKSVGSSQVWIAYATYCAM